MRFFLILSVLVFSACSTEPVADKDFKKDNAKSETKELSKEELAARAEAERKAEAERLSNEANARLESLNREFAQANGEWKKKYVRLSSEDEQKSHADNRPCLQFAEQLVDLAEKYPATKAADSAWYLAAKYGVGETKTTAAEAVLNAAREDDDPTRVRSRLELLMVHTEGQVQKQAMQKLLNIANKKIESSESFEIFKSLTSCSKVEKLADDGAIVFPGNADIRAKAIRQLKFFVQADITSEKSIECLHLLFKFGPEPTQEAAIRQILSHHLNHPATLQLTRDLSNAVTKLNEDRLHEIIEKSTGTTRANAMVSLARFYANHQRKSQLLEVNHSDDEGTNDAEHAAYLKEGVDSDRLKALEQMMAGYVEDHEEILAQAKRELFAMQNLAVGQTAPEITGEDLKGEEFTLSQYRGKVVLLSFWGDWSDDCQSMYRHHQSLVRRLEGKPFAIVGVNSDLSKDNALQAIENKKLNWRSFWDGPQGQQGPISTDWCVYDWPTIYLIDKDGVIRNKDLQGDSLNRSIEVLMKEMGEEVKLVGMEDPAAPVPDSNEENKSTESNPSEKKSDEQSKSDSPSEDRNDETATDQGS